MKACWYFMAIVVAFSWLAHFVSFFLDGDSGMRSVHASLATLFAIAWLYLLDARDRW